MALYPPPRENVPIFDSSNFEINNTALTVDTGLDYFLAFPTAQGAETLADTTVAGSFTALGTANFSSTVLGSLTSSALQPPSNDSSTKIPTTAWVQTAVSGGGSSPNLSQVLLVGNSAGATSINMNNNPISNVTTLNLSGILTTTNEIDMTGTSPTLGTIKSRQYRFRDINTGTLNTSAIYSTVNTLSIESYPATTNTNSLTRFLVRDTANVDIQALTITPTVTNCSVALDMNGGNSTLSSVRSRVYSFRDITSGSVLTSSIYYQASGMVLDCNTTNSSVGILTRDGSGNTVSSLTVQSSQMLAQVPLDLVNTGSFFNATVRARYFNIRDLVSSAQTSSGIYFSSNNLQIDSDNDGVTDTSLFLRTRKPSGTQTNALQLTNTTVKTDCYAVTPLSTADNSNSIPTTSWVQSVLSTFTPANSIKRASSAGNFTSAAPNQVFQVNIPLSGGTFLVPPPTNGWLQNQGVTFRVNYFQSFNPRATSPFDSQNYISFSSMLTIYPFRFNTLGWLSGTPPRGRVSDNVITGASGDNTNYVVLDAFSPAGRQFWSNDISFQSNSSFAGRLYIYGSNTNINNVIFELTKPNGFSAANEIYSYTFSLELVNQSNTFSNITSSSFNISNI